MKIEVVLKKSEDDRSYEIFFVNHDTCQACLVSRIEGDIYVAKEKSDQLAELLECSVKALNSDSNEKNEEEANYSPENSARLFEE